MGAFGAQLGVPETFLQEEVKGQSHAILFRGFCHLCRLPAGHTYSMLNFTKMLRLRQTRALPWQNADIFKMSGGKNAACVKSIFQRRSSLCFSGRRWHEEETPGYPASRALAEKIKNASCLHFYEVPYRNRPHPSATRQCYLRRFLNNWWGQKFHPTREACGCTGQPTLSPPRISRGLCQSQGCRRQLWCEWLDLFNDSGHSPCVHVPQRPRSSDHPPAVIADFRLMYN